MTVSTDKAKEVFTGDGSTTVFPVTFRIFKEDDIEVVVDGTTQTLNTDYTVENIDNSSFDVDFSVSAAPANNAEIIVKRELDVVQETDYTENNSFPADSHEDAIDLLTMINQQQKEELGRTLKASLAENAIADLPAPADRQGKFLRFTNDANANPEAVAITELTGGVVLDEDDFVSDSATDAPSQQSTSVFIDTSIKDREPFVNVLDHGATGDGVTDDSTAIQAAVDSFSAGGTVFFPPGTYLIGTTITLPSRVNLRGEFQYAGGIKLQSSEFGPTRIRISASVGFDMTFPGGNSFQNLIIMKEGVDFPQTQAEIAAWTGTAIRGRGSRGTYINEVAIGGFLRGIDIDEDGSSNGAGRTHLDHLMIDCLNGVKLGRGIAVDKLYAVHVFPALSNEVTTTDDIERPGTAFEFNDAGAWPRLSSCFAFGFNVGYDCLDTTFASFNGCGVDYGTATINANPVGFRLRGTATSTKIVGCDIGGDINQGVRVDISGTGANHGVVISGCQFAPNAGINQISINVLDGEYVAVTGSRFMNATTAVRLGGDIGCQVSVGGSSFDSISRLFDYASAGLTTNTVTWGEGNFVGSLSVEEWRNAVDQKGSVASASTVTLPQNTLLVEITGTTTINTFTEGIPRDVTVEFVGGLTVAHLSGNVSLKSGANTAFSAGERARFTCTGSTWYQG